MSNNIPEGTQNFDAEKVQLSKNQKRRIKDNKKKKEEVFKTNLLTRGEITFDDLKFDADPFKEHATILQEFRPKIILKGDDPLFKLFEGIIQEQFGHFELTIDDYYEIANKVNQYNTTIL